MSLFSNRRSFLLAAGLSLVSQPAFAGIFGRRCKRRSLFRRRHKCYGYGGGPRTCNGAVCIDSLMYTVEDGDGNALYYVYTAYVCPDETSPITIESLDELDEDETCAACAGGDPCYLDGGDSSDIPFPNATDETEAKVRPVGSPHRLFDTGSNDNNTGLFRDGIDEHGEYKGRNGTVIDGKEYYVVDEDDDDGVSHRFQLVWDRDTESGFGYEITGSMPDTNTRVLNSRKVKKRPSTYYDYGWTMLVKIRNGDNRRFLVVLKN